MFHEILHRPAYALARIQMVTGEEIQAETGAMVSMSDTIKLDTGTRGGILKGLRRSILGGETFFMNTFKAEQPGEVTLAPSLPGDIEALELRGDTVLVQSGSFLAATKDVKIDATWGGAKQFFTREGLWMLKCTGHGLLILSSYGAIHRVDLEPMQKYTVDTGHMVAFDETVRYDVGRAGNWKSTILSGEGLVCKLEGPGRFYMQTRSEDAFFDWLLPRLPNKK